MVYNSRMEDIMESNEFDTEIEEFTLPEAGIFTDEEDVAAPWSVEMSGRSISDVMANAEKVARLAASRPSIDHLEDAVVQDEMGMYVLLAKPGEKIVIERFASVLPTKPWLDTKIYIVDRIDIATGNVGLWDPELHRAAGTNYVQGLKAGYRFKLATKSTRIEGKRRRGRPRKNPTVEAAPPPPTLDANGKPIKKKRGRPAGVKNRSKDEIKADKVAKAEVRAAKKAARLQKRKG